MTVKRPRIVCLCGSTRFHDAFVLAAYRETMAGRIVLSVVFAPDVSADGHGESAGGTPEEKTMLDELHLARIDLSDEILVLNVDGYVGTSTEMDTAYAIGMGKRVRFLEKEAGDRYLQDKSHRLGTLVGAFAAKAAGMKQPPATATGAYPCTWCKDPHFADERPLRPYRQIET